MFTTLSSDCINNAMLNALVVKQYQKQLWNYSSSILSSQEMACDWSKFPWLETFTSTHIFNSALLLYDHKYRCKLSYEWSSYTTKLSRALLHWLVVFSFQVCWQKNGFI